MYVYVVMTGSQLHSVWTTDELARECIERLNLNQPVVMPMQLLGGEHIEMLCD